jgi:alkylhydroperoxidase/carboxymuconolactone decarboxylase family protein YurZ
VSGTSRTDAVVERAERVLGRGAPAWRELAEADPEFADAFSRYLEATTDSGVLEPAVRELLLLAHDATVTVLDADGVAIRVGRARDAGASEREVLDVLELLALITVHSLTTGLPLLYGAHEFGRPERTRGRYWDDFEARVPGFNGMLEHALPGVFDAYRDLGRVLWREGGLAPKWRELVLVVADLSTSHLYRSGAAMHIHAALRQGATREEIAAAIALAVPTGARTLELGTAALRDHRPGAAEPTADERT